MALVLLSLNPLLGIAILAVLGVALIMIGVESGIESRRVASAERARIDAVHARYRR